MSFAWKLRARVSAAAIVIAAATAPCQAAYGQTAPTAGENDAPAPEAQAEEAAPAGLGDIVVTGMRGRQRLADIPRSITYIGEAEVTTQLDTSPDLLDLLTRQVPGIATPDSRTFAIGQSTLRGRRMQIIIDGIVMTSPFFDIGAERSTIAPEQIDAVEVVRGSTSAFGFGATGGIINIRSRNPLHEKTGGYTTLQVRGQPEDNLGDSLAVRGSQRLTYNNETFGIELNGVYERTQAGFDGVGDLIPSSLTHFDSESYNIGARAAARLGGRQELLVGYNFYKTLALHTTAAIGADPINGVKGRAENLGLNVPNLAVYAISQGADLPRNYRLAHLATTEYTYDDIAGSDLSVLGYYAYSRFRFTPGTEVIAGVPSITLERSVDEKWGVRTTVDTGFTAWGRQHSLVWGGDFQHAYFSQPIETPGTRNTPPISQNTWAGFAQLTLHATDQLTVNGGLRYETSKATVPDFIAAVGPRRGLTVLGGDIRFKAWLPNVGFVYRFSDQVSLFASYALGAGVPEVLRGLRGTPALSVATAIEADTQTVRNYEAGVRGRLFGGVNYSVAGYYSVSSLGASLLLDPITQLAYVERAPEKIWGLDLTLDARLTSQLSAGGTVGLIDGKREVAGGSVPFRADRMSPMKISAFADYKLGGADLHLDALYGGSRNAFPGSLVQFEGRVREIFLVNASVGFDLGQGRLSVAAENLFDRQYISQPAQGRGQAQAYVAEAGRTFSLTYRINW